MDFDNLILPGSDFDQLTVLLVSSSHYH